VKFVKYFLIFLLGASIIGVAGYFFFKMKKGEEITISPTPVPNFTSDKSNFSLEEAPSESLRGEIIKMVGEVKFLGRTATEASILASTSAKVQQGENYITGEGGSLSINFKDTVSIDLSENTEVDIIQTLPANIVFSQVAGIANYKVIAKSSVTIRTSYLLTELRGEANISRDSDKQIVIVTIKSGSAIMAYNDKNYVSHEVTINEGQTYTFNYGTRKGALE
jgi:hypothetical protein